MARDLRINLCTYATKGLKIEFKLRNKRSLFCWEYLVVMCEGVLCGCANLSVNDTGSNGDAYFSGRHHISP